VHLITESERNFAKQRSPTTLSTKQMIVLKNKRAETPSF